ncbi:hypothetical protein O3M35_008613 [Rhynocoris fuscipes]|uniref:F-box domain-containing protein n=1 Tax=Rhynocoris fuscipes TaxID=488301 RepID=A0AAW1D989_9HEMI
MDISVRNGIVLENILHLVNVKTAMRLSAVCKRWYEVINNDTVLWNRFVQLEGIDDIEYWNSVDDNDQWILGTPCKPKKIFLNHRRNDYFCIRDNRFKKYKLTTDYHSFYQYDGKSLLLFLDDHLHIYKFINDNLQLFQTIFHKIFTCRNYRCFTIFSNGEFIVISYETCTLIYRLESDKYIPHNDEFFKSKRNLKHGTLLSSNIYVGTIKKRSNSTAIYTIVNTVVAWSITERRVIFEIYHYKYLHYGYGILYTYDLKRKNVVLYNENFEVICRVIQCFEHGIFDVMRNNKLLVIVYNTESSFIGVSSWDKTTGQICLGSKSFECNRITSFYKFHIVNDRIIVCYIYEGVNTVLEAYDASFCHIWTQRLNIAALYCNLDKLFLVYGKKRPVPIIECRNVVDGNVLFTTRIDMDKFDHYYSFARDLVLFRSMESPGISNAFIRGMGMFRSMKASPVSHITLLIYR